MANAYLQSLLADNEAVRAEARQHPMALIRFAFQPILVFLAALVCLAIGMWLTPDGQGLFNDFVRWIDTLLGLLTAGLFILAIVWFPVQAFRWLQRRYMVTDRRVLYVDGVLRKNSVDAGLNMITDVGFRQGVLGRTLDYGDLVVATASNRPLHFRQIRDALAFKQAIMAAQHATVEARADEILASKGLGPASVAPMAAIATSAPATAVTAATTTAPVPPVAPATPAWDGSDVPQMAEDDLPPAEPLIFGTRSQEATPDASGASADASGAAADDVAGDGIAVNDGIVADDVKAADDGATAGDDVPADDGIAADASELAAQAASDTTADAATIGETVGSVATPGTDAGEVATAATVTASDAGEADDVGEAVEAAEHADSVTELAEGSADATEVTQAASEAAGGDGAAVEVAEAAGGDGAAVEVPGGHLAALDEVDATMGGIGAGAKGSGADSVTSALARLAELHDTGALTDEEFEARKQELLDRL